MERYNKIKTLIMAFCFILCLAAHYIWVVKYNNLCQKAAVLENHINVVKNSMQMDGAFWSQLNRIPVFGKYLPTFPNLEALSTAAAEGRTFRSQQSSSFNLQKNIAICRSLLDEVHGHVDQWNKFITRVPLGNLGVVEVPVMIDNMLSYSLHFPCIETFLLASLVVVICLQSVIYRRFFISSSSDNGNQKVESKFTKQDDGVKADVTLQATWTDGLSLRPQQPQFRPHWNDARGADARRGLREKHDNTKQTHITHEELEVRQITALGRGAYGVVDLVEFNLQKVVRKMSCRNFGRIDLEEVRVLKQLDGAGGAPKVIAVSPKAMLLTRVGSITFEEFIETCSDPIDLIEALYNASKNLKQIHNLGISHNDIKSDNVMIDEFDCTNCSFIDFGLAREMGYGAKVPCDQRQGIKWMAPEILNGMPATPKSDVFSFGIMMGQICNVQKLRGCPLPQTVQILSDQASDSDPKLRSSLQQVIDGLRAEL